MDSHQGSVVSARSHDETPSMSGSSLAAAYGQSQPIEQQQPGLSAIWTANGLQNSRDTMHSPTAMQAQATTPMDIKPASSAVIRRDTSSTTMSDDVRAGLHMSNAMAAPPQRITWAFPSEDNFPMLGRTLSAPTYSNLPAPGKSPSVASSGFLEDGIFEPGSTYQSLHQTLRSHVFRAAYSTPAPQHPDYHVYDDLLTLEPDSDTSQLATPLLTHQATRSINSSSSPGFELDAALEFKLWKAWTEEVSNWVSRHLECTLFEMKEWMSDIRAA